MSLRDLIEYKKFVLSAKWCISACFVTWCRSFMYIKESSHPKTEPCGTPWSLMRVSDLEFLIETCWCCWVRKVLNHLSDIYSTYIPQCSNFERWISGSTVSNAFCRSRNTPHVISPLSIAFLISSVILISAWVVEWRLWKPYWLVYKKFSIGIILACLRILGCEWFWEKLFKLF